MKKWVISVFVVFMSLVSTSCRRADDSFAATTVATSPYAGVYNVGLLRHDAGSQLVGQVTIGENGKIFGTVGERQGAGLGFDPDSARTLTGIVSSTGTIKVSLQGTTFQGQLDSRPLSDGFGPTITPVNSPRPAYGMVLLFPS